MLFVYLSQAFSVVSTIATLAEFGNTNSGENAQRGSQIGSSLTAILVYGIGILVAHQYSTLGLRIVCIISYLFLHSAHNRMNELFRLILIYLFVISSLLGLA